MKIIDLLNKIANNEQVPQKIVFDGLTYTWYEEEKDYVSGTHWLFDEYVIADILNKEVEILEITITYKPDKIEKLDLTEVEGKIYGTYATYIDIAMGNKINELIDEVNKLNE